MIAPSFRRRYVAAIALVAAGATAAAAVQRHIFVTSVSGNGRLGDWPDAGAATGLAAGDAICRERAAAGGLANAGTYRAWLSSSTTDAYCHVHGLDGKTIDDDCGGLPLVIYGPWYATSGYLAVTPQLSKLTASTDRATYAPIAFDEYGSQVPDESLFAWTGTHATGDAASNTCNDWISGSVSYKGQFGSALMAGDSWTDANFGSCDNLRRLICVEPGNSDAYSPKWSPGRPVFVTSNFGPAVMANWSEAGGSSGIAAADKVCRARAKAAHLPDPGSFWAWLSDDSHDAKDRLAGSGPIRRLDGYSVASSTADLLDGRTSNAIHVDESGRYFTYVAGVFTGTWTDGLADDLNCLDWTNASAGNALIGTAQIGRHRGWTAMIGLSCGSTAHLYCFSNSYVLFWDGFDTTGNTARWSATQY